LAHDRGQEILSRLKKLEKQLENARESFDLATKMVEKGRRTAAKMKKAIRALDIPEKAATKGRTRKKR
jgi:hypothetical protein